MTSEDIKSLTGQYVMSTYGRFPVAIDHGQGATLYDPEGNAYIDFTSGIGVCDLGYGNEPWADAIAAQAKKLGHVSNLFYTEPAAKLAETLCKRTGESCVFFANGGGEANEGMIKLARKYSFDKYGKGRATIITLNNSFHGRTITTLMATGQEVFHNYFFPFTEGFRYADANDLASLEAAAGLVVQETLTDAFLEDVQAKGTYLRNQIEVMSLPCFGQTRGMGLMIGIEVKDGYNKSEIANKLIENGLLVLTAGPGMRLLPPLVITKEEMDQGLAIMKKVLG